MSRRKQIDRDARSKVQAATRVKSGRGKKGDSAQSTGLRPVRNKTRSTAEAGESLSESNSTRARLIEAARQLFLVNGYEGTGISEILCKTGINSGSLYYFFKKKEDLLLAVGEIARAGLVQGHELEKKSIWLLYVLVESTEDTLVKVNKAGGASHELEGEGKDNIVLIADPTGGLLAIYELPQPEDES